MGYWKCGSIISTQDYRLVANACQFSPQKISKILQNTDRRKHYIQYYSCAYTRPTTRNSYTIMYMTSDGSCKYGSVQYFLEAVRLNEVSVLAVVLPFTTSIVSLHGIPIQHLLAVTLESREEFIPAQNIKRKCIFVNVDNCNYVTCPMHDVCMSLCS